MGRMFKATHVVLGLLCMMYFITYVDRVNVGTAASAIQKELGLSTHSSVWSFRLRVSLPDLPGDRRSRRRSLRPAPYAVRLRPDMGGRNRVDRPCQRPRVALPVSRCLASVKAPPSRPQRAPCNTGRLSGKRGFAQGITHSFARLGQRHHAPLVAWLMVPFTWRGSFVVLGGVSLSGSLPGSGISATSQKDHPAITPDELATLPQRAVAGRVKIPWASGATHVARHPDLFLLRLVPVAVSQLAAAVLQEQL